MKTETKYGFESIDYANYDFNLCEEKEEFLKQLETAVPKKVRKFNSYGTNWHLATPICGYYFYINGVMFEITNYVDCIGNFLGFLTQLAYFDNKPLMCAINNEGTFDIMTALPVEKDNVRISIFNYVKDTEDIHLNVNPMCDMIINKQVFIRQIYEFLQKISVDWINTVPEEQNHGDMEMIDEILKSLDIYFNNPAEFKKTYDPKLYFKVFDIAYKDLSGEWKFILCYEEDERSNIEYWENLKQQNKILDFDFIEQKPKYYWQWTCDSSGKYKRIKRKREDIKIYNDIVSRKEDKNWIYSTDTKNWYAANEVIPEPVSESKIYEDFELSFDIDDNEYCDQHSHIVWYLEDDFYLPCNFVLKSGGEIIYKDISVNFNFFKGVKDFLKQTENGENVRFYDKCYSDDRMLVWQKENGYIRIMFLKAEEYCERENIIYRFQEGYTGEDTLLADITIKKDEFISRYLKEADKIYKKVDKVRQERPNTKKKHFSVVFPEKELENYGISYEIGLWDVAEYTTIKDIKQRINSIKDYLIGKPLTKILFLGDLNDNEYIFKDNLWHDHSRKTGEEYTNEYGQNIAPAPVILFFGKNRLELEVKGDERVNEHWIKLCYNSIYDAEEIEKEFPGTNHSVRFPNLIGQKLKEIKICKRCNNIELVFENGYGCYIYDDWSCDYGTSFQELTPEYYRKKEYVPLAYKKNNNDSWRFEIFVFDQNEKCKIKRERIKNFIEKNNVRSYHICKEYLLTPDEKAEQYVLNLLRYYHYEGWCYEPETDTWYYKDEIMDEPQKQSEISNVEVNLKINEEQIKNDFEYYDVWEHNIYTPFEMAIKTEHQNIVLNDEYDNKIKIMLRKFITGIQNNQTVQISPYWNNSIILTAYPKEGNKIRITAFRNRFSEEVYEFDAIIPKDEFIKQLEKNMLLLRNRQKIINKKIKELNMKYLLREGKVEFSGNKKQLIAYVKEHYKDEYWVRENGKKFDTDFGSFKYAIESIGLQLSDKMSNKEYNKTPRR